jgi:very-short-patch-repair endonuclease
MICFLHNCLTNFTIMLRAHELRTQNVRYINGQIKVFIIDFVNYCTAKVIREADGQIYKVENTDLRAFQTR